MLPNPPRVTLSEEEMAFARDIGLKRRAESRRMGLKETLPENDNGELHDICGAMAEYAYCIYRGRPWVAGINTFKGPDCGESTQVRWTWRLDGSLIVRPGDNPGHVYVLVTGSPPTFNIVGWIHGKDAMKDEFWRPDPLPAAWFVPQDRLTPFK